MDTRNKLLEAEYFLKALIATQDKPEVFRFNLSAFLASWKSVLDVMLYDFLEFFSLGLTHEDKVLPEYFYIVAKSHNNKPALGFFRWWDKERDSLSKKNPLWSMRNFHLHRGYPEEITQIVYSINSLSSGIGFSLVPVSGIAYVSDSPQALLEAKLQEVLNLCKNGYATMEAIVKDAEKQFQVQL
jgi:hypothetical protein